MKTILVTGSTDGIGFATAKKLFLSGQKVLVHGRSEERAKHAVSKLGIYIGDKDQQALSRVLPVWGDFTKMSEVVALARQVQKLAPDLDVLINNAGVYMNERVVTEDGFETTFAVNHLAPFLLTHHLLPVLQSRPSARILTVSSKAHTRARFDIDNLQGEKHFEPYEMYSSTKLFNILFTWCLAALLKDTKVTANSLHPGVIDTKLLHAGFSIQGEAVDRGAETPVFLATSPQVEGVTGSYFSSNTKVFPSRLAQDENTAVKLWKKTEELLQPWLHP